MSEENTKEKWSVLDIKTSTWSVERTLAPLVAQVTSLVTAKTTNKRRGRSKKAHVLVAAVDTATSNFVEKGEVIAAENPEIRVQMLAAVEDVRVTGRVMSEASLEFANDPCSSVKRGNMVRASRQLLSAVTRLLILADMIDVNLLLSKLNKVQDDLDLVRTASTQTELNNGIHKFGKSSIELMSQAAKRQRELKDPALRDDLAAARAVVKKHLMMLMTASKILLSHPDIEAAQANRDYVFDQICDAVNIISDVAQGKTSGLNTEENGELVAAFDEFDDQILSELVTGDKLSDSAHLEERLETIISGAALIADSDCTRDNRRERIVSECNSVREGLQDILDLYIANSEEKLKAELDLAIESMCRKTRRLRRQLRKAIVDHVSDGFVESMGPLITLVDAARDGQEEEVDAYGELFTEHAEKLSEIANLACCMSSNMDGVKIVRYAVQQILKLYPQVINAARVLAKRPNSKAAKENMCVFKDAWETQIRLLTDAVDDIVEVKEFLAVSENHMLEDINKCCTALNDREAASLSKAAGTLRGRSGRISSVATAEMDNYAPGFYTEKVMEAIKLLRSAAMPNFTSKVKQVLAILNADPPGEVDENEFIDASRMVYDGVREVRRAVLLNRAEEEEESDIEWEGIVEYRTQNFAVAQRATQEVIDEYPEIDGICTAREAMKILPEQEKLLIAEHVECFRNEKLKFDQEVSKWDDNGNDVLLIAKHMCMIMIDMTDFTRGRGPLKTTKHVIASAKQISESGTRLDKLARRIADQCPESSTKKDLMAYLQMIALYTHQLNIISQVKTDVQDVSGELVVSGLDSATSLIQAAKNLMNAVVSTVKASYVASTKYRRQLAGAGLAVAPIVVWRMKAPDKKPLVRTEPPEEVRAKVKKGGHEKQTSPLKALSDFERTDSEDNLCSS